MSLSQAVLEGMLHARVKDPAVFRALLTEVPGASWQELQARALTRALTRGLDAPHWRARVSLTPRAIAADPFAAVLAFPALSKREYWDAGAQLRLPDVASDYVFYTSGTEGGIPTEQPWDRWTFDKSFGEASALALCSVGARARERLLLGSPGFGAVGRAFGYAAQLLGLELHADPKAFSDDESFAATLAFVREGVSLLVAPPGVLLILVQRLLDAGIDPRSLGVRGIISGVGTFLSARHVDFLVEHFDPEVIHEMGGKNEILHAPGGRRYLRADHPAGAGALSEAGFLHVLPWAAHVVSVEREAFARGEHQPTAAGEPGVLLMTRLSAGGEGCVAFINDAGDYGRTRGFGGVDVPLSACGNSMPAFAFGGRTSQSIDNKIGDTIFSEELLRALSLAAADVQLDARTAASLRVQVLLVHAADPLAPDAMYWIIGAPAEAPAAALRAVGARWLERWPRCGLYRKQMAAVMGFGGFAVVERGALPHAGRDKAQYPPALALRAAAGQSQAQVFEHHLEHTLGADILVRGAAP